MIGTRKTRITAIVIVLALVGALVGSPVKLDDGQVELSEPNPAVGEANAIACGGICIGAVLTTGAVVGGSIGIAIGNALGDKKQELSKAETQEETKDTLFAYTDNIRQYGNKTLTASDNDNYAAQATVWMAAKSKAVEMYNNGKSKSQIKIELKEFIEDEMSERERAVIEAWEYSTSKVRYAATVQNSSNLNMLQVIVYNSGEYNGKLLDRDQENVTYTLLNGTEVQYSTMWVQDNNGNQDYIPINNSNGWNYNLSLSYDHIDVKHSEFDNFQILDINKWQSRLSNLASTTTELKGNVNAFVDGFTSQFARGELTPPEVAPEQWARNASNDYAKTGIPAHAMLSLRAMGYNGSLNQSHQIKLPNGKILNGTLFTRGDANISLGEQFVGSGKPPVYLVTDDGVRRVDGNFTLNNATNYKTGEQLGYVDFGSFDEGWSSTNYSTLSDQISSLEDVHDNHNYRAPASSGLGGLGDTANALFGGIASFLGISLRLFLLLLGAGIVVYLLLTGAG